MNFRNKFDSKKTVLPLRPYGVVSWWDDTTNSQVYAGLTGVAFQTRSQTYVVSWVNGFTCLNDLGKEVTATNFDDGVVSVLWTSMDRVIGVQIAYLHPDHTYRLTHPDWDQMNLDPRFQVSPLDWFQSWADSVTMHVASRLADVKFKITRRSLERQFRELDKKIAGEK